MTQIPGEEHKELRRLHSEADARDRDIRDLGEREHRYEDLVARLRREADVRDEKLAELRGRLEAATHELKNLRAIRGKSVV